MSQLVLAGVHWFHGIIPLRAPPCQHLFYKLPEGDLTLLGRVTPSDTCSNQPYTVEGYLKYLLKGAVNTAQGRTESGV